MQHTLQTLTSEMFIVCISNSSAICSYLADVLVAKNGPMRTGIQVRTPRARTGRMQVAEIEI